MSFAGAGCFTLPFLTVNWLANDYVLTENVKLLLYKAIPSHLFSLSNYQIPVNEESSLWSSICTSGVWRRLLHRGPRVSGESLKQRVKVHRLIYTMEGQKERSVRTRIWRGLFRWALLNNLNIPTGPLRQRRWIYKCSGRDSCILHFILNLGVSDLINKQIEMNRSRNATANAGVTSFWGF